MLGTESYVYDPVGNLTSRVAGGVSTSFGYDAIDQLVSESRTGYACAYAYDANGNRTSKTLNGVSDVYSVDDGDKLLSVSRGGVTIKSFAYDAQGRTTGITTASGTTSMSYDYEDRMTGIGYPSTATNTFAYNALDTRVGKTDSGGTFSFLRDGVGVTDPVLSDGAATYTPGVSERRGSTSKFTHQDRLGSTTLMTDTAQTITDTRAADAFGNPTSATGSTPTPFTFAGAWGYQQDSDSGLMLLGHRYYDPSTGRFLTRDPAKDGRNWYGYCANNSTTWTDSDGRAAILALGLYAVPGLGEVLLVGTIIVGGTYAVVKGVEYINDRLRNSEQTPPFNGEPGSTVRGPKTSRHYGEDGYPEVDRDWDEADRDHSHDWGRPAKGGRPTHQDRGLPRPVRPGDPPPPWGSQVGSGETINPGRANSRAG